MKKWNKPVIFFSGFTLVIICGLFLIKQKFGSCEALAIGGQKRLVSFMVFTPEECYGLNKSSTYSGVWKIGIRTNEFIPDNNKALSQPLLVGEGGVAIARYWARITRDETAILKITFRGRSANSVDFLGKPSGIYVTDVIDMKKYEGVDRVL